MLSLSDYQALHNGTGRKLIDVFQEHRLEVILANIRGLPVPDEVLKRHHLTRYVPSADSPIVAEQGDQVEVICRHCGVGRISPMMVLAPYNWSMCNDCRYTREMEAYRDLVIPPLHPTWLQHVDVEQPLLDRLNALFQHQPSWLVPRPTGDPKDLRWRVDFDDPDYADSVIYRNQAHLQLNKHRNGLMILGYLDGWASTISKVQVEKHIRRLLKHAANNPRGQRSLF